MMALDYRIIVVAAIKFFTDRLFGTKNNSNSNSIVVVDSYIS